MTSASLPSASRKPVDLGDLSAVDFADLLLSALATRSAGAIVLEPMGRCHALRYENQDASNTIAWIDTELADAVIVRLAVVARQPLGASGSQVSRLRVAIDDGPGRPSEAVDMLFASRVTPRGLGAELHRITSQALSTSSRVQSPDGMPRTDRYQFIEMIGSGGMGMVYRARHVALDKLVAIKVLQADLASQPLLAAQFTVEARAACRVRHPGVVDVSDFGRLDDGRSFLVMELIEWPRLDQLLKECGALESGRALDVAWSVADTLRATSSRGVVHRDLKPSNIFVSPQGQVKVADFGISWILDGSHQAVREAQSGTVLGTVGFMSPEQARGDATDARSDIFSLGCVLYVMTTGALPALPSTRTKSSNEEYTPLRRDFPDSVPEAVRAIVERATAALPGDRYQDFDELMFDLSRAGRDLPAVGWRKWAEE